MAREHVLAIDQGTTGSTALVIDQHVAVVGRGYEEVPQHFPRPGWVEHDPEDLWHTSVGAAQKALEQAHLGPGELAAIGVTNQRETTILWDRKTGEPLHRAIVWQDRRTAPMCAELRSRGLERTVRQHTGLLIDAYFSGTKLAWLLESLHGVRARAERGELAFGTVDSWMLYRLTGGAVHATDVTNASRTMLFDIRSLQWDQELLKELRIPPEVLPDVHPSSHPFGHAVPGVLGAEVPVTALLGDQQAALFAQACFHPGQTKNTYGTGSFVLANAGGHPYLDQQSLISSVAASMDGEPAQYALEGSIFVSGSAVQWIRDELGLISDASETEALARSVADTGDVWFVPALTGLGAPYWDPYARGTLLGLTRGTKRAHIVRAVLESIAFSTRDVVEAIEGQTPIRVGELRADGGAVANEFLMQFQADVLGIPVDIPTQLESTSLGSGLLAGVGTRLWAGRAELEQKRTTGRRYEPVMTADERDSRYQRWCKAVERAREWAVVS